MVNGLVGDILKTGNESWSGYWGKRKVWLALSKRAPAYRKIVRIFSQLGLSQEGKILDVGCGPGKLAHFWLQQGFDVNGVDTSDVALRLTAEKHVKVMKADAGRLPFRDNSFDLVYSDGLLEHFANPEPILAESFRISRKYVLSLVPRNACLDTILSAIFKTPKAYEKKKHEWIELHRKFEPINVKTENVFQLFAILCEVNKGH